MDEMSKQKRLWMGKPDPYARLREIERLDLDEDYVEIAHLFFADFSSAMFSTGAAEFMFTFAAPKISRVLYASGEIEKRLDKRIVDTGLFTAINFMHGFEGKGKEAADRVREMHSRYRIAGDEFVATACDEIVVALRSAELFGWRPVTDKEREAVRLFFSARALAYGSPTKLPDSLAGVYEFMETYIANECRYEKRNHILTAKLLDWYGTKVARPLRPILRAMLLAPQDPRILSACGVKRPSALMRKIGMALLKRRAGKGPVPDSDSDALAEFARTVYPDGYTIEDLGTKPPSRTVPTPRQNALV